MVVVQVCVGSSCHIKGSAEIVSLLEQAISENNLAEEVTLVGSFCIGKCNRVGVTVQVNDEVFVGITRESFREFFNNHILSAVQNERA